MAKRLVDIVGLLPEAELTGEANKIIEAIAYDSRKVKAGTLFICLRGAAADGHNYVEEAYNRGAVAVVAEKNVPAFPGLTIVRVPDTRVAMGIIAPYFFDYPGRKLRMIGVTGTNGKTTTTYLIKSILERAGKKTGLIGTIQVLIGSRSLPVKNTTPDVIDLQETLALMVAEGMEYVVMEVSSHALALGRVEGCEFDTGVFTNLTRDHLDFHVTLEEYLAAKTKLFDMLSATNIYKHGKTAVINRDDLSSGVIQEHSRCRTITYGVENAADLQAVNIDVRASGVFFAVLGMGAAPCPLKLKITGIFNVYNVLGAIGATLAEGVDPSIIKLALEEFCSVPGRFELVDEGQSFAVIVDYAHTPDGLENILRTAKQFTQGRIIVVFGCGGDRDRTKRPIMGRLAVEYGDIVIATSDNPRSEDPLAILQEIEVGIRAGLSSGKDYTMCADRHEAIERAIKLALPGDTVIIAGKGHETYQILKDKVIAFDDREVARGILRELQQA
ncbi:MAG: UDP-N-acetylmuramoyl-L-alanyl-D-glutamate--2,6-diaminopimelate ligase [Negativicutes bacterium]|nr:UDP-N-acetylmuramoyl-L-alanyl-D-glutamate--2,6-diaminopimelate ligase [Negativicutes bacterium]